MKQTIRNRWCSVLLAGCLALSLTACGGSGDEPQGEGGSPGAAAETPAGDSQGEVGGGSGLTQNAEGFYEIDSAEDFAAYAQLLKDSALQAWEEKDADHRLDQSAVLLADIDVSEVLSPDSDLLPLGGPYPMEADGEEELVQASFRGEFDGGGHTISGLQVDTTGRGQAAGLFGQLSSSDGNAGDVASIHDLTIADSSFTGDGYVGAFVGIFRNYSVLENCVTAETVTVASPEGRAGGVAGCAEGDETLLLRCANYGTVSGEEAGGIAGIAGGYSYLVQCENYGTVTGDDAAGILAVHSGSSYYDGLVIGCVNYGTVTASDGGSAFGIVAENGSTLRYNVNAGLVDGGESGEAFAIGKRDGDIACCGNIGTVTCSDPYVYQFVCSWELGTYPELSAEGLAKVYGWTKAETELTPVEASSAADGSLTSALQANDSYGYWTQGDAFPVWDGQGGLEEYDWLQEQLGL